MQVINELHSKLKGFQKKMLAFQHLILLHLFYFFGIGLTFLFAKIAGKHFFLNEKKNSNWILRTKESASKKMF